MADDTHTADMAAQLALARSGERADAFLEEHTRLARLQIAQHEEENAMRRRLLKLEHASAILKLALEIAVGLVAAAILAGLAAAMWNAARDNGLVVESFSVPSDLAARGLSGEVVAAKLLDKLSWLQQQTQSSRASSSYENNWGNDIKLQIPDTGVSIGEFNRSLHAWLGHQTRITGEVYRTASGLALTARAGRSLAPTFAGSDLDKLVRKAAEAVYRATQPYRYAVYLANAGRTKEAEALYAELIARGSPQDRAWALVGVQNLYVGRGETALALRALDRALAIRPDFIMAYINISGVEGQLQHDDATVAAQKKVVALFDSGNDSDVDRKFFALLLPPVRAALAAGLGDYAGQLRFNAEIEQLPDQNGQVETARQNDVIAHAFLHDAAGVRRAFAELPPTTNPRTLLSRAGNRAFCDVLLGDPRTVFAVRPKLEAAFAKLGPAGRDTLTRQLWPVAAYALALAGDMKAAHALIDRTPLDCIICLRVRGRIDTFERNWDGAQYWFARALEGAATTPFVWTDWGHMLLAKDDLAAAIAKFRQAVARGPGYADPLEMWGEALIKQNRSDLALAKFDAAAKLAPRWSRLHRKWGEALSYLDRRDEAAKQFALAKETAP